MQVLIRKRSKVYKTGDMKVYMSSEGLSER